MTRKLLEKVHLEAEICWDFITGKDALYLAMCNSGHKQFWGMFFTYCHGCYKLSLCTKTRNKKLTTEHSRTRKKHNKRKGHLITYKFGEFRCSERVMSTWLFFFFLPEETTSDTSFFSVWAINPMTLKIGNPPNKLVMQLIEDTTTASLGMMKQRNSGKFTIISWLSNRTGTSVDDGEARGKD